MATTTTKPLAFTADLRIEPTRIVGFGGRALADLLDEATRYARTGQGVTTGGLLFSQEHLRYAEPTQLSDVSVAGNLARHGRVRQTYGPTNRSATRWPDRAAGVRALGEPGLARESRGAGAARHSDR